jgi:hypothetical protein
MGSEGRDRLLEPSWCSCRNSFPCPRKTHGLIRAHGLVQRAQAAAGHKLHDCTWQLCRGRRCQAWARGLKAAFAVLGFGKPPTPRLRAGVGEEDGGHRARLLPPTHTQAVNLSNRKRPPNATSSATSASPNSSVDCLSASSFVPSLHVSPSLTSLSESLCLSC